MQLNGPHTEHEHASVSLKVLLLIFGVLLTGTLGYMIWDQNTAADTTDNTAPSVKQEAVMETTDELKTFKTPTALTYTNSDLGFTITLTDDWKGYVVGETKTDVVFYAPTTDTKFISDSSTPKGFWPIFMIGKLSAAQWAEEEELGLASDGGSQWIEKLGTKDEDIFTWTYANQDSPDDVISHRDKAKETVATLKVIE